MMAHHRMNSQEKEGRETPTETNKRGKKEKEKERGKERNKINREIPNQRRTTK
jgi:hypothetical protein